MGKYTDPQMPYVEANYQGKRQRPTAIMLRPSFTTSDKGAALGVAMYYHSKTSPHDSLHYVVDEKERFRCVPDNKIAGHWHCDSKGVLRIGICAEPVSNIQFWDETVHYKVLRNTARLVAELTLLHNIKVRFLSEKDLSRWEKHRWRRRGGIFVDVSGQEDFPVESFLAEVKAQRALKTHI